MSDRKLKSVEYRVDWDVLCDAWNPGTVLRNTADNLARQLGGTIGGRRTLVLRMEGYASE